MDEHPCKKLIYYRGLEGGEEIPCQRGIFEVEGSGLALGIELVLEAGEEEAKELLRIVFIIRVKVAFRYFHYRIGTIAVIVRVTGFNDIVIGVAEFYVAL